MDQDSFRRLLQTPRYPSASPASGFLPSTSKPKAKVIDPSQPAFKPRKVKKTTEGQYRDRAAERRVGEGNDYAQVEAVLEDFEKRNVGQDKSTLDAQRRYLGGDGAHSVLVKGLDVALLEQNRARAAALSTEDDESLEKAFLESTSASADTTNQAQVPKKRTREDLLRELKEKRTAQQPAEGAGAGKVKRVGEEVRLLEQAKQAGKFRPIGFKPIGSGAGAEPGKMKKKKKVKGEEGQVEGERKKKRKVAQEGVKDVVVPHMTVTTEVIATHAQIAQLAKPPTPVPEPGALPEDIDIFADAGEYEGLQLDDSEFEDEPAGPSKPHDLEEGEKKVGEEVVPSPPNVSRRWIDTGSPEPEPTPPAKSALLSSVLGTTSTSASAPKGREGEREPDEEGEEAEVEQPPARLVPLASSALPSIKDFLAMERAASGGAGKRRKRKGGGGEKKGAEGTEEGKKQSAEAKAERDYKRLKSYTDKKAA